MGPGPARMEPYGSTPITFKFFPIRKEEGGEDERKGKVREP